MLNELSKRDFRVMIGSHLKVSGNRNVYIFKTIFVIKHEEECANTNILPQMLPFVIRYCLAKFT